MILILSPFTKCCEQAKLAFIGESPLGRYIPDAFDDDDADACKYDVNGRCWKFGLLTRYALECTGTQWINLALTRFSQTENKRFLYITPFSMAKTHSLFTAIYSRHHSTIIICVPFTEYAVFFFTPFCVCSNTHSSALLHFLK